MDLAKLKLDQFQNKVAINFPEKYDPNIDQIEGFVDCLLYYIDKIEDVQNFINLCKTSKLPKSNRTILVYEKGRKDQVNRDAIVQPFRDGSEKDNFKLRAPMLCAISDKLSALVMSYESER